MGGERGLLFHLVPCCAHDGGFRALPAPLASARPPLTAPHRTLSSFCDAALTSTRSLACQAASCDERR